MRQPAPLKGESESTQGLKLLLQPILAVTNHKYSGMETLLIQTIVGNTPTSEDAPSRPDHRTEQHITVDLPDSIRHNSDSNRYLINRNAPIGGQAVKLSDIEADNYDLKMVDDYIAIALCDLEEKDNEKNVSRKSFLEITQLLKTIITGLIEDRKAFRNKVATWAYVRKMQRRERSDAQVTGNRVGEDNVDEDESTHLEIGNFTTTSLTKPMY